MRRSAVSLSIFFFSRGLPTEEREFNCDPAVCRCCLHASDFFLCFSFFMCNNSNGDRNDTLSLVKLFAQLP